MDEWNSGKVTWTSARKRAKGVRIKRTQRKNRKRTRRAQTKRRRTKAKRDRQETERGWKLKIDGRVDSAERSWIA